MQPLHRSLLALVVLAPIALALSVRASDATSASPSAVASPAAATPLASHIYKWEDLAVKPTGVGERRDVCDQRTTTLEKLECHISTLNAGQPSHPPHRHPQEELIILKEGTLDVFINGTTQRVGAGSLFFFASYDLHAVRNVGDKPATYFVFNFATAATHTIPTTPAAESAAPGILDSSVFDWEKIPVTTTKTGERRQILDSPTVTLTRLESHVTTLNPGESPHPPKGQADEELLLLKEGSLEVNLNGATQVIAPGTICFFSSNDVFGVKNVGKTPVSYYILRVVTSATPKTAAN